jgi:hypothetical protein
MLLSVKNGGIARHTLFIAVLSADGVANIFGCDVPRFQPVPSDCGAATFCLLSFWRRMTR